MNKISFWGFVILLSLIIILEPFFIAIEMNLFPSKLFPYIAKKILSFLISFELNEIPEKKIFFLLLSILVK